MAGNFVNDCVCFIDRHNKKTTNGLLSLEKTVKQTPQRSLFKLSLCFLLLKDTRDFLLLISDALLNQYANSIHNDHQFRMGWNVNDIGPLAVISSTTMTG